MNMLRIRGLAAKAGKSKSSCYQDIKDGLLPPPVCIGGRCMAWPEPEIDAINRARVAGKSEDQIRALVQQLVEIRKQAA
jgi:prophage regulatory protein